MVKLLKRSILRIYTKYNTVHYYTQYVHYQFVSLYPMLLEQLFLNWACHFPISSHQTRYGQLNQNFFFKMSIPVSQQQTKITCRKTVFFCDGRIKEFQTVRAQMKFYKYLNLRPTFLHSSHSHSRRGTEYKWCHPFLFSKQTYLGKLVNM